MALLSSFPATNLLGNASSSSPSTVSPTSSANITGGSQTFTATYRTATFQLNVSQVSPSSSHLLDVFVRHSVDAGQNSDDFIRFLQVPGKTPTTSTQVAQWIRDFAASSSISANVQSVRAVSSQTLAQGTVLQGPVGATWTAVAVASGASSSQPWRLTLSAQVAQ